MAMSATETGRAQDKLFKTLRRPPLSLHYLPKPIFLFSYLLACWGFAAGNVTLTNPMNHFALRVVVFSRQPLVGAAITADIVVWRGVIAADERASLVLVSTCRWCDCLSRVWGI